MEKEILYQLARVRQQGQATMMEPQTYENDANGNMIVPERQAGSMETEPAWEYVLEKTGDSVLDDANYLAAMCD